jgi:hypothetical protein
LSKNSLLSLCNQKVHYCVHKRPPPDHNLSQPNPVCPIHSHLPKVQLNVTLPPTPRSSQWSLPFRPPNKNPVNTSPTNTIVPALLILLDLITLTVLGEEYTGYEVHHYAVFSMIHLSPF